MELCPFALRRALVLHRIFITLLSTLFNMQSVILATLLAGLMLPIQGSAIAIPREGMRCVMNSK